MAQTDLLLGLPDMVARIIKTFLLAGLCSICPAMAQQTAPLEICPEHPYYFRHGGQHVVLVGVSDRDMFWIWQNDKGFSWRKYLDDIAAHHLNYVRQDVCCWGSLLAVQEYPAQLSGAAWAFARTGPGKAVDGKPKFDLTKYDQSYFDERLKPFLHEAAKQGIYVELTLFEEFRRARDFEQSLYAPANNTNELGLKPRQITSNAALDNPLVMAIQHAFVDKILAETAPFCNIIFEISNEAGGDRWVAHMIDYIHTHPVHPGRLVSAGEQTSSFDPRKGDNDIVIKHRGGGGDYATDEDIWNHHKALLHFRVGRPVSHNEYFLFANRSTSDLDFPRKMMWADFVAGGHSNFYDFTFWRGTGRTLADGMPSRMPPAKILRGGGLLLDFLADNNIHFWQMTPHDELATLKDSSNGYVMTLAKPGSEYICYLLGAGPVTVRLELTDGIFNVRWYDPKSGTMISRTPTVQSTNGEFRSPPFEQDMVLYVHRSKNAKPRPTGSSP